MSFFIFTIETNPDLNTMARANKKGKKQSINGNKTGGSEKQENVQSPIKKVMTIHLSYTMVIAVYFICM